MGLDPKRGLRLQRSSLPGPSQAQRGRDPVAGQREPGVRGQGDTVLHVLDSGRAARCVDAVRRGVGLRERTDDPVYDYAKRVNRYLRVIGKVLLPLVSESVVHAREERLPFGAKPFKADGHVRSVGGSPIILGWFRKPGVPDVRYLFVANRSFASVANSRLQLSRSVRGAFELDASTGRFARAAVQAAHGRRYLRPRLSPGEALLYKLRIRG